MGIPSVTRRNQVRFATFAGDESIACRIWYDGPGIATLDLTTDNTREFNFLVGGAADTSVNSDGLIDYDNDVQDAGDLADLINADTDGYWHCALIDTLRETNWQNWVVFSAVGVTPVGKDVSANNGTDPPNAVVLSIGPEAEPAYYGEAQDRQSSEQNNITSRAAAVRSAVLPAIAPNGGIPDRSLRFPNVSRIHGVTVTAGNGGAPDLDIYSSSQAEDTKMLSINLIEDTLYEKSYGLNEIVGEDGRRIVVVVNGSVGAGTLDACEIELHGSFGEQGEILSAKSQL